MDSLRGSGESTKLIYTKSLWQNVAGSRVTLGTDLTGPSNSSGERQGDTSIQSRGLTKYTGGRDTSPYVYLLISAHRDGSPQNLNLILTKHTYIQPSYLAEDRKLPDNARQPGDGGIAACPVKRNMSGTIPNQVLLLGGMYP